jgi:hypothetical protein
MMSNKFDLPVSSWWILGITALAVVMATAVAVAQSFGGLAS